MFGAVHRLFRLLGGYTGDKSLKEVMSGEVGVDGQPQRLNSSAVYRCVDIISSAIATLPLYVVRKSVDGEMVRDPKHPLSLLFRRPNQWMSGLDFRLLMLSRMLLHGQGFAKIVRNGAGKVTEIWPIDNDAITVDFDVLGQAVRYRGTVNGMAQAEIPSKDVLHFRGLTLDGYTGISVLNLARQAIDFALNAEGYGASLYKKRMNTDGAIELPEGRALSDTAYERLKESVREVRQSSSQGASTIILEDGARWKQMAMSPDDAQFLDSRRFQRSEIAMYFGVPPHLLGDVEKSTSWGTGIEQQNIGFVTYTLAKWMALFEAPIERAFFSVESETGFSHDISALVKGDLKTRTAHYESSLMWGWRSPNEVRRKEGLPTREGGDVYYPPPGTPSDGGTQKQPGV